MSILAQTHPTLLDHKKRIDPDGKIAQTIELLAETNEILSDFVMLEGNLPNGHQTTVRTELPEEYWRLANQGIPPSKSRTAQITEGVGRMKAKSEIDVEIADLNGNRNAFRASEQFAFIMALNNELSP